MELEVESANVPLRRTQIRLAAALLLGVSAASCRAPAPESPSDDQVQPASLESLDTVDVAVRQEIEALLTAEPDPLNISLVLEDAGISEAVIGPEGGAVEVTTSGGGTYRLTIPAQALTRPTRIRMIPVASAEGLPFDGGVVAGVELEPSGLQLLVPATLSLELPGSVRVGDAWGVSTLAGGEQAALYPATFGDSAVALTLTGFSGYNIALGRRGAEVLAEHPVTSIGRRAVAYLEKIRHAAGARVNETTPLEFTDEEWQQMELLAELWEVAGLGPLRAGALADDIQFIRFTYELNLMLNVQNMLQYYGRTLWEVELLSPLWEEPADNAIERAAERCKTEHRFGELDWILELVQQKQLWGIDSDSADFFDARRACGVFRLSFESTITQRGSGEVTTNDQLMFLGGEVFDLVPDEYLAQDAELFNEPSKGALNYIEASGTSELRGVSGRCVAETVGGIGSTMAARLVDIQVRPRRFGPWSVPEIYGTQVMPPIDPLDGNTRILFDPGDPREKIRGDCMGDDKPVEVELWDQIFWLNHFNAIMDPAKWAVVFGTGEQPSDEFAEDTGFALEVAEFVGDHIYARMSFQDCRTVSGEGGSGETCENTFFVLYHEPPETNPTG